VFSASHMARKDGAVRKEKKVFNPAKDFPITNAILSFLLVALIPWLFMGVCQTKERMIFLASLLVAVFVGIMATEKFAELLGNYISGTVLAKAPFNNPLQVTPGGPRSASMVKFKAQFWQLIIHVGMGGLETYVLYQMRSTDGVDLFSEVHRANLLLEPSHPILETLYMVQMAIWVVTGMFHVFVFEKQSDYLVMLAHHVATIGLVGLSFTYNYQRFGLLVLYVHDVSDIMIDLLKLTNYLKLDIERGVPLVEPVFVTNLITWVYFRMYLLPYVIVYQGTMGGYECAQVLTGTNGDIEAAKVLAKTQNLCYYPETDVYSDIIEQGIKAAQIRGELAPYSGVMYSAMVAIALLGLLCVMHVYWFALFMRILYGLLTEDDAHEVGAATYEGDDTEQSKND